MINNFDNCVENVQDKHFFITDGNDRKPAFWVKGNGEFEIINNTEYSINFLKVDDCISQSNDGKRCDCAIYNETIFCFIELKNTKRTNWKGQRQSAEEQLKATILQFKNEKITKNKILEAYMCCTCKIDGNFTKISSATNKIETITYFENELNTSLYCDTKKEFN